jgi:Zn-dependent peptidase ImmA (M78 family)
MSIFKAFKFLQPHQIEAIALDYLNQLKMDNQDCPVDVFWIAEHFGLDFWWDDIPADDYGFTIAAMILPQEKLIGINEKIKNFHEGFIRSTIGHEIGHWILHINHEEVARGDRLLKKGVKLKIKPLMRQSEKALQGIEWQAQYFSSCLLMPRHILIEKSKNKSLTKWRDLADLAEELGVTRANLLYRLRFLGWIKQKGRNIYRLKQVDN